jgi:hypothetical protein
MKLTISIALFAVIALVWWLPQPTQEETIQPAPMQTKQTTPDVTIAYAQPSTPKNSPTQKKLPLYLDELGFLPPSDNPKLARLEQSYFLQAKRYSEDFNQSIWQSVDQASLMKLPAINDVAISVLGGINVQTEDATTFEQRANYQENVARDERNKENEQNSNTQEEESQSQSFSMQVTTQEGETIEAYDKQTLGASLPIQLTDGVNFVFNIDAKYAKVSPKAIVLTINDVAYNINLDGVQAGSFKVITFEE